MVEQFYQKQRLPFLMNGEAEKERVDAAERNDSILTLQESFLKRAKKSTLKAM